MSFLDTDAIVLRDVRYKDADKILTVLTRDAGVQTVRARGACRKGYQQAASTQLLAYSRMNLFLYKDRLSLREASLHDTWLPLREDLERMLLGSYAGEACLAIAPEGVACPELLELLLVTLHRLTYKRQSCRFVKTVFELGLMLQGGFWPDISGCPVCGREEPENMLLHLTQGRLHCRGCKDGMERGVSLPLSGGGLAALRYIENSPINRSFSFTLGGTELRLLADVSEAYMMTQLERGFPSLDMYKQITRNDV